MTRDEAVAIAMVYVRQRYPIVPPMGDALLITEAEYGRLEELSLGTGTPDDRLALIGKWVIPFECSWDTDDYGMPHRLVLLVDDANRTVQQLPIHQ
jgi:hypothetical protein